MGRRFLFLCLSALRRVFQLAVLGGRFLFGIGIGERRGEDLKLGEGGGGYARRKSVLRNEFHQEEENGEPDIDCRCPCSCCVRGPLDLLLLQLGG